MELIFDPAAWASLLTLTALEIVLGVDNIVVLAILTGKLPKREARRARSAGLALALALRIVLLSAISWMTRLSAPIFFAAGTGFSWRDLILIGGGLFLMLKATQEIHAEIEGEAKDSQPARIPARFGAVIAQIAAMDLIFSLDSIVTAVGLARDIEVMALAICIAVGIMYFAANTASDFIERHPTVKMLALCFLILIGVMLVADGFGAHIPRVYIYFAMTFAGLVEALNIWAKNGAARQNAGAASPAAASNAARSALTPPRPGAAVFKAQGSSRKKTTVLQTAEQAGKRPGRKKSRRK
jgi:predicted tellurium resistance membrane protein TerC